VDLALLGSSEPLLREVECTLVQAATQHDAPTLYLL
jgi:hypothetical protein